MSAHEEGSRPPVSAKAVALSGLVIVVLVGGTVYGLRKTATGASDHSEEINVAQQWVKEKFGSQTVFPPDEASCQRTEDGKTSVTGSVHVVSASGVSANYSYTVLMHQSEDSGWVADDISLVPI